MKPTHTKTTHTPTTLLLLTLTLHLTTHHTTHTQPPPTQPTQTQNQTPTQPTQPNQPNQTPTPNPNQQPTITFNFRDTPIQHALDHLSQTANLIILLQTPITGTINTWTHNPITPDQAIQLIDTILAHQNAAAIRTGNILKIIPRTQAQQHHHPIKKGNNPDHIPTTDQIITQIIPVRYADATQLIQNLQPLLPPETTLTANQSSNAILLTDTQTNINRITQIIQALDTSISTITTIQIYTLQHADAQELAQTIQQIFDQPTNQTNPTTPSRDPRSEFFRRFISSRGGDNNRNRERDQTNNNTQNQALQAATQVTAIPDTRTNSLIIAAPDQYHPNIQHIIQQIDQPTNDITQLQLFQLQHADAQETAQILTDLFDTQDEQNQQNNRTRFERRPTNDRTTPQLQQQTTITAIPDPRTNTILIRATAGTMTQIQNMITQLDQNTARQQKVYIYPLQHADTDNLAQILRGMFENRQNNNTLNPNRQNTQQNNPLTNRTTNNQPLRNTNP